ncbi:MAG: hypothetical protein MI747_04535 [Desulfobacterales bacterium]|nr:hypothetical protein [Desulfobacterales bacterium]
MTPSLNSAYWYKVSPLKPLLRKELVISRHVYRRHPWYVLKNPLDGRVHRFNAVSYKAIGQMNGEWTMEEIWQDILGNTTEDIPTQDELIALLVQLHQADLVICNLHHSTAALARDTAKSPKGASPGLLGFSPLIMKLPLLDPDRILNRMSPIATALFSRLGLLIWALVVTGAASMAIAHGDDLFKAFAGHFTSAHSLVLLWLTYPFMKILHEFGHGLAIKRYGGSVHEMGILMVAFTPLAYVDAGDSAVFPKKSQRMMVAGAGIMVELFLSGIAFFIWRSHDTGIIGSLALSVMALGGISSLLFNGNPLLRYDGYYLLSDLVEIPNLAQRSSQYLGYLCRRYLLGIPRSQSPVTAPGERGWFLLYAPLSFAYRLLVLTSLIWMISGRFFILGIVFGAWGILSLFILPALRTCKHFMAQPGVREKRIRLATLFTLAAVGLATAVFIYPAPNRTLTQGVVWLPEQSVLRAGTDFEVRRVNVGNDHLVSAQTLIITGEAPALSHRIHIQETRISELLARYRALDLEKMTEKKIIWDELQNIKGELSHLRQKQAHLQLFSPGKGRISLVKPDSLEGRHVKKGETLGYVIGDHRPIIRAVVGQSDIDRVRRRVKQVRVRLAEMPSKAFFADIVRIVPAPDYRLPAASLGKACGGIFPTDPSDPEGLRVMDTVFKVDLCLADPAPAIRIGGRAMVRFDHEAKPLYRQWLDEFHTLWTRIFSV